MPDSSEASGLLFLPEVEAPPAAELPRPVRERFQPLRAGIVNLWQYDDQELAFHDGRLILRGENGSGKSKALELLLPFLFDADLSPQRLDPFGGTSRTMEWNLLQDGRYESRVGYVWLELGRCESTALPVAEAVAADSVEVYWTLGCGLRASQRTRRVDAWYFLTSRRLGGGLDLLTPGRTPLLKEQLRQAIGTSGWIFDTGKDYREKLDQQLFGLGEDRFASLRHLLLQLRRPHLSEKLDPRTLAELLKESLPPLDRDRIGELSEGFERLEKDQQDLARAQAAAQGVGAFLQLYRDFARGLGRGRAGDVRQADSRYHKTAGDAREAQAEEERLDLVVADLALRERQADADIEAVTAAIGVLEDSPAMRTAAVLRVRREQAELAAKRAAEAAEACQRQEGTVARLRGEVEIAAQEAERREQEHAESAATAAAAARGAGLAAVHAAALDALPGRPAAARAAVEAAVRQRREGIEELRRLETERDRAQGVEERAQERLREAVEQLAAAALRRQAAGGEAGERREALAAALTAWAQGLAELRLEAAETATLRAAVAALGAGDEGSLSTAIAAAARPRRDAMVALRTALEAELRRLAAEREAAEEERRRVAAARDLGPEAPRLRTADRTGRAGAPLYLLCDFATDFPEASRAGLEAALEASGLLDAWVMPGGEVVAAGTRDSFLVPVPPRRTEPEPDPAAAAVDAGAGAGKTLAAALVPVPGHGVSEEMLQALLRSVEWDPDSSEPGGASVRRAGEPGSAVSWSPAPAAGEDRDAAAAVSGDGGFRLGPLRGAAGKPVAEHIGAGARAAARERRLQELAARLADLDRERADLGAQDEALAARLERLDGEVAAAPAAAPLLRALAQAAAAAADESRRAAERDAAGERAAAAGAALAAAQRRLEARARELDLREHLGRLQDHADRLQEFLGAFQGLLATLPPAVRARERSSRAAVQLDQGLSWLAEVRRRAGDNAAAAAVARAEHAELEATAGAAAREVVERHALHVARRGELARQRKQLGDEASTHREKRAGIRERLTHLRADLGKVEDERVRAAARLRRLGEAGLVALTLAAPPEDAPASWSLTRSLEVAREIERENDGVDLAPEAASRRANRLHERFRQLESELGADFRASLEQDEDLAVVRILYNGRDHDVAGLLAVLHDGIETRRALLAEHERELLRRFLLDEVGVHLRERLQRARALVAHMNELLESCRTASGLALRLAWEPAPEAPDQVRDVVRLLQTDLELLPDGERRRIEAFFLRRIEEARQQWETVPWRDHLLAALDYRSWYTFRIQRRSPDDGGWVDLTRRGHAASSGGEKAIALHLPLFAAAAAHYRSALPQAPRIVLLDEAFVGIDQSMRGRCMGLLVALDLDFLMTSHDEWGCYEELPGVSIAQLYRDPNLDGVMAVFFTWNGRSLEQARPPAGGGGG
jgi:hypothetical protein